MKDKRGFTLIELIVVLALAGIVMSVVMSFFIANYRSYETINTESEVQYQSQYIINYMTNKILEAKLYNESSEEFEFVDGSFASFEQHDEKIKYTYGTTADKESVYLGNYVDNLIIETNGTNEVRITLVLLKKGSVPYPAEQVVYMRNSQN